jgi:hypothetical protein
LVQSDTQWTLALAAQRVVLDGGVQRGSAPTCFIHYLAGDCAWR